MSVYRMVDLVLINILWATIAIVCNAIIGDDRFYLY
uniref:Uncharacterized protein n=1 Tax=Rhizophora mucronata TaxID=61149 RepID=A0A2P2PTY1_RHIMU